MGLNNSDELINCRIGENIFPDGDKNDWISDECCHNVQLSGHQYRITISPLDVSETNRVLGLMLYPFLCIHVSPLPTLSFSPPFPCNNIPSNLFIMTSLQKLQVDVFTASLYLLPFLPVRNPVNSG